MKPEERQGMVMLRISMENKLWKALKGDTEIRCPRDTHGGCWFCGSKHFESTKMVHEGDCPWADAKRLLEENDET